MFDREIIMLVLAVGLSSIACANAAAQSTEAPGPAKTANPPSLQDSKVLTGKERLGKKWTDEQRLDNCNVPIEKRGEKPRSNACKAKSADGLTRRTTSPGSRLRPG